MQQFFVSAFVAWHNRRHNGVAGLYRANTFALWNAHRRTQKSDEKKRGDAGVFKVKFTFAGINLYAVLVVYSMAHKMFVAN